MSIVKIQRKGQMTLPSGVRAAVGLADGDLVDVKVAGRKIVITPALVIDRTQFPTAEDEYTPEQRRILNASLAQAEKGPYYGPFKNGAEVAAFLKKWQRRSKSAKAKKTR
ncbi:putative Transcriptional regulator, AbrB family [Candidatus Sulfopaludibacter sp. SbA4]|nr:putative Transcriptional regulator, AbrB family [Candidatus Sulfopaludibacter sp. SbA4]